MINALQLFYIFILVLMASACASSSCDEVQKAVPAACEAQVYESPEGEVISVREALLSTRYTSLEELETVVDIQYFLGSEPEACRSLPSVHLTQCGDSTRVVSILEQGISEGDFKKAREGGWGEKAQVAFASPYALANINDILRVFNLSRRRHRIFGGGDVAFFDLAETSVCNILAEDADRIPDRDTTEKGYLNTFNHVTAQAFVTSFFSEELADFIADVHERENMPELITGNFTKDQLTNPDNNAIDNYVDMINNEWGQELGKHLSQKYQIDRNTYWTPQLLADYLNDVQSYYTWCFDVHFIPYRPSDPLVIRFARKINSLMDEIPQTRHPNQKD